MRRSRLFASALLLFAACGGSPVGSWVCDRPGVVGELKKMLDVARRDVPPDAEDRVEEALKPLAERAKFADSRIEIRADGGCLLEMRDRKEVRQADGAWKLAGERITITFTFEGEDAPLVIAGTFTGDSLTVVEEVAAKEVRTRFKRADR